MRVDKSTLSAWFGSDVARKVEEAVRRCGASIEGRSKEECIEGFSAEDAAFYKETLGVLEALEVEGFEDAGENTGRYGNPSFRVFHRGVMERVDARLDKEELRKYVWYSLGDPKRLDYGSGHELCFFLFLVAKSFLDSGRVLFLPVFVLFCGYIGIAQRVQTKFRLEPAGSKGVWGFDDYQFLSFYFGASQMVGRDEFSPPRMCFDQTMVEQHKGQFLYMASVSFVLSNKGPDFRRHSPCLFQETKNPDWSIVRENIFQLFLEGVLAKHQAIHHIEFGGIVSAMEM
ncbi:MAG: serine/threonine-protein phosphatase 2A activator [Amphiamblys sp. WSBS2006]|nr:MAG: serine/threonine-protein phosphatase 2A activator [Amphiamblys sp. WSBS2006]